MGSARAVVQTDRLGTAIRALGDSLSTLLANPELIVLLALGLVALVLLAFAVRRYLRSRGEELASILESETDVTVLTHPNPDPDAMAAAMGVATLAESVGTDATIRYSGQIRHQENRAFRTVLDLDIERLEDVSELTGEAVVLVDHNVPRGFDGADRLRPFAVVDHHPGEGKGEAFTDVRTDYGAAASIVTEYLRDVGADPVPPDRHASETAASVTVPTRTATGLLYGILADTGNLTTGASAADFAAAGYLYRGVDDDLLDRVANPSVDAEVLEVKARAIAGRQVEGSFAVADVGAVSNVDAIPQAADELIRLEGITAVVICAERDGVLHFSGRSRDDRVHMGRTLEAAVDVFPEASAGGHARMGGGQVPQIRSATDGGTDVAPESRDRLINRLFDAMAGDV